MGELDLTKILKVGDIVYSTILGECVVKDINPISAYSILVSNGHHNRNYTKSGRYIPGIGECTLFPSKENRDWSSFKRKSFTIRLTVESSSDKLDKDFIKALIDNGDYIIE